ncbi:hypothetical protein HKD37_05G012616 [Glycine soja]
MNLAIVFLLKNKRRKSVTWEINKGKDTTKEDSQVSSKDNGDHTLVGQLAKQLVEKSSNSFGANTEKNPKEECKAIVTRSRKLVAAEDEDVVALKEQAILKDTTVKKKNEVTDAMSQRGEKQIMVEEKEIKDQENKIEV